LDELENRFKYPATPDTTLFTYDESSGYYYDSSTNLFYDATSQYFYNSELAIFMYWDPQKSTYILAPSDGNGAATTGAAANSHQVGVDVSMMEFF
jgi:RNA-binding protein 5/10